MGIGRFYIDCIRKRKTETINDRGRPITTYTNTNIKGYISAFFRQQETRVTDKDTSELWFKFFTNDFNLRVLDLIEYEGDTYEVLSDGKNTVHRNHHIKAVLRKVANVRK